MGLGKSTASTNTLPVVHIVLLGIVSTLLFLPVLRTPHWGTFDDANIIVQLGRRLHDLPSTYKYILMAGPNRVGYFWFLMFLWKLAPENARFFFLVNSVVFAATAIITYCNALLISGRPWISFATTSLLFSIPGLFEVIYVLDKQEMYLPILFSLCILIHIINVRFELSRNNSLLSSCALFLLCVAAYSLKETSGLIILFSGTVFVIGFITKNIAIGKQLKQCILLGTTMLAGLFTLRLVAAPLHQYVRLTFDLATIVSKIMAYAQFMPLYFAGTFFSIAALVFLCTLKPKTESYRTVVSLVIGLTACSIAAPIGFASFDTFSQLLLYIWFPAYVFLLPALAFSIAYFVAERKNIEIAATCSLLFFSLAIFPNEWLRGQFQLNMDSLTEEVAHYAACLCKGASSQTIGALPTFTPMSSEVPENLEFFIRDKLEPRYYDKADETLLGHEFAMLNFLTSSVDGNDMATLRNSFLSAPCKNECPPDFAGWRGYQMLAGATPFRSWVERPLPRNALLFIPYGNVPEKIMIRGQGLFGNGVASSLYAFPQLKLAEAQSLEKNITSIYGEQYKLGWKIYRVLDTQPISIPDSTSDSWLSSDQKLFYDSSKSAIEFESTQPISTNWSVFSDSGDKQDLLPRRVKGRLQVVLRLAKGSSGRHWLRFHNSNPSEKLHFDDIKMTALTEQSLELGLTMDNWLIDGSNIIFSDKLNNQKLFLNSDRVFASGMFVQGVNKAPIKVHEHGIEISLREGRRMANGLQCLTLHASSCLQSEREHRPLIIHVTEHYLKM